MTRALDDLHDRVPRDRHASRVVGRRQEHDRRSRIDGVEHRLQRKRQIRLGSDADEPCTSRIGARGVHVEGRLGNDRLDGALCTSAPKRAQRNGEDALVETVRQHRLLGGDAETRGARGSRRVVVGIEGGLLASDRLQRREHARRTASGVLVEVQTKRRIWAWRPVVISHDFVSRIRIESGVGA